MRITRKPHVIVTSYPAEEHVAPLMKLAYKIAENGIKVTFVNADIMHHRIIPVSFVVADVSAWWAIKVAEKLDIKRAMIAPFGVGNLALQLQARKLIDSGLIDLNGKKLNVSHSDIVIVYSMCRNSFGKRLNNLPVKRNCSLESRGAHVEHGKGIECRKFHFQKIYPEDFRIAKISNWILVNSFYELESSVYDLIPKALPIGPLIMNDDQLEHQKEDSTFLNWLDQQPKNSVLYASFGSIAVYNQLQFDELAYAFELIGRPFLWVVGSDFTKAANFPEGFIERVANFGKIVKWAREEKVLSHPSVACFILSCGWNSVIKGVSKGVPFICWPYGSDQRRNSRVICEIWKVGVQVIPDHNGIVKSQETKSKISKLVSSRDIKLNSRKLMEIGSRSNGSEGGSSFNNFMNFIQHVKC